MVTACITAAAYHQNQTSGRIGIVDTVDHSSLIGSGDPMRKAIIVAVVSIRIVGKRCELQVVRHHELTAQIERLVFTNEVSAACCRLQGYGSAIILVISLANIYIFLVIRKIHHGGNLTRHDQLIGCQRRAYTVFREATGKIHAVAVLGQGNFQSCHRNGDLHRTVGVNCSGSALHAGDRTGGHIHGQGLTIDTQISSIGILCIDRQI